MRSSLLVVTLALILAGCQSAGTVSFRTASGSPAAETVNGLLARPEGKGPFPAVVLLHACRGMTPHVTGDWPSFLRGLGYVVLSVDTLGPRGMRDCAQMGGGNIPQSEDAFGALDYLATLPEVDASRVAVVGFSMGALTITQYIVPRTLTRDRARDFRAAIALYGRCTLRSEPGDMALLQIIGEHDPAAPLCNTARERGITGIVVIPGAHHAFDSPQASGKHDPFGTYMRYSEAATARARELTREFLARHLGGPGR